MYRWEKAGASSAARGNRYEREFKNPSFSSTLLDEIYRSIDEGDNKLEGLRFYGETVLKEQSKGCRAMEEEQEVPPLRRACLIEKWMDKKVSQRVITTQQQRRRDLAEFGRDCHYHHDQDALFFSTTSRSSDSSSGGFSSSDVDSIYGGRSKSSSLAPPRPVRTSVPAPPEKTERTRTTLLYEQRELHEFDDYHHNSAADHTSPRLEETLFKSKSRALKIYNNLKKMKQPISPSGKFASFINSLFTTGATKKSKNCSSATRNCREEKKFQAGKESTCSSASSFSRSCLSKNSPSTRERLRNGVKRTVRFVDEDFKPRGHKSLNEQKEKEQPNPMSVSLPTAWKIGKSPSRKVDYELKHQLMEKGRRVEEMAREFLKDYHQIQKQNDLVRRDVCRNRNRHYEVDYDYEDDDALSYSSSDLFELDHLAVIGNDRYHQELPVYETTHVDSNRAIANGLMM